MNKLNFKIIIITIKLKIIKIILLKKWKKYNINTNKLIKIITMMIIKIKILIIKNKYKNKIITMIENNSNNIKIINYK